jgi:hypothetical protein
VDVDAPPILAAMALKSVISLIGETSRTGQAAT